MPPQTTLLDFIRSRGLTGAKEGCAEGECGACAVLLGRNAVNSCLMFLPMAAGQDIYTVESVGSPEEPHVVQQALAQAGGSQCGYCTPGFVISLFAEYYRPDRSGPCDVEALGGNLCRCTGYRPIRDAALSLGPAVDDRFSRIAATTLQPFSYQYDDVSFHRPTCLAECLALLQNEPESRIVAGNTDLGVESNLKYKQYPHLISVEAIPELVSFCDTEDAVEIGAGLTLTEIEARWTTSPAVVKEWFPLFASPLIRNRATLGGNLCTASPIGDAAPLLLALNASVNIASVAGMRTIPLDSFFTGYRKTALEEGEILVSVTLPKPFPTFARFYKAAKRRVDDISTVSACFAISDGQTRAAFGGVAAVPTVGLSRPLAPISDHRGSAEYRAALAQSLLEKFRSEHEMGR